MSLITGFLSGAQAPPKQDATSTIQTLCLRLASATLLEDRRAAVLGLRSFARDYQELVASEGLRGLIASLDKDREDTDTVKAVLETLLTLFVRDDANPESSEDIALWLADEFTQKQENITILLDLLEDTDFYILLYTLQLLAAISNNRPTRTQECIFTAPTGVERLVTMLDDKRDAIRNEAVLLIIHVSAGHTDIQKRVAYENAFERILAIIDTEGGVEGGIVVQDCLQLLTNLLTFNLSNQRHFQEISGGVPRLAKLLDLANREVLPFAKEQRDTNIQYALRLVRLFVVPGGLGTAANQDSLVAAGVLHLVVRIAFSSVDLVVRGDALKAAADLIDGNKQLQEAFAQIVVAPPELQPPKENKVGGGGEDNKLDGAEEAAAVECGVIEGLLELALMNSSIHAIDARFAACRCLEAYFNGNHDVRVHFLNYAIHLHSEGDSSPNALTCLLHLDSASRGDPYRVWIASVILIHLIYEDTEAKVLATAVREGDAEAGEEEVTAIQGISANLITALQHQYDPRISIGYLMLLCIWLFGDSDAVDDFLSEGASVQALVGAVKENGSDPIVQGLSTFLLGILYEFSHRNSPVPRAQMHEVLATQAGMGRDLFVNKLTQLRTHPLIRDFEISKDNFMPGHHRRKHGLPEVYFDQVFVGFLKDNYDQVMRAVDKDPNLETKITANGVTKVANGVDLEELDALREQVRAKDEALAAVADERWALEQQHSAAIDTLRAEHYSALDTQEKEFAAKEAALRKQILAAQTQHSQLQLSFQRSREALSTETRKNQETAEAARKKFEAEKAAAEERTRTIMEEMRQRNRRSIEEKDTQIQALRKQIGELQQAAKAASTQTDTLKRQGEEMARRHQVALDELTDANRTAEETAARLGAELEASRRSVEERSGEIQMLRQQLQAAANQHRSLDEAKRQVEEEVLALRQQLERHQQQLDAATSQHQKELGDSQQESDRLRLELDVVRKQHADASAALEAAKKEHVAALEAAEKQHAADLSFAHEENAAEVAKISAERDEARKLASEAEATIKEKEAAINEKEAVAKEKDEAIKERDELKKECGEAKKKAEEIQSELDDLFMVLGDLEEKRKADKRRLKELGAEVSEDEDEDDNDEEEEE
ncbi:p115 like vesicle tethering protein [Sphaerosporella brunnea]|uniref:p115 like vesicle tethering protein n=1 Tax=Sphaerosporella brunnea TaxID=1250544 RepID=A0A5J5EPU1_9PEZI|nr:p115 like vesicle tethering protein [Sphaerosporella brunnea]